MAVSFKENIDQEWEAELFKEKLLRASRLQDSNQEECLQIWQELADMGSPLASLYLGDAYANGRFGVRDIEIGMKLYRRSADLGSIEAKHRLAYWLWFKRDYASSIELLESAAMQGFLPAMYVLGAVYYTDYDGHTVKSDIPLALSYWKKAEAMGSLEAKRRLSIYLRRPGAGFLSKVLGLVKLVTLMPDFVYTLMRRPDSDRLRAWTYRTYTIT